MKRKKKVLVLYNQLFHYRIPVFDILSHEFDLTVAYSEGPEPPFVPGFRTLKFPVSRFGRFVIHKDNLHRICQAYEVVIAYGDISWLSLSTLTFFPGRNYKIIFWTIGVSASYDKKYDEVNRWDGLRKFFYKRADALIFYTDYPITKYGDLSSFNKDSMFVAWNTVAVSRDFNEEIRKDSLLFIGTLYLEKGLLSLLESYRAAFVRHPGILPLNIVGGGKEFEKVNNWITAHGLSHKISLKGPVYDIQAKAGYFRRAYACISPSQAGLSVLESMGYGVPFVTMKDAITGGERFNIAHNNTGLLMDDPDELQDIIVDICANPQAYREMGERARQFYEFFRTPEVMASGISDAIRYVLTEAHPESKDLTTVLN